MIPNPISSFSFYSIIKALNASGYLSHPKWGKGKRIKAPREMLLGGNRDAGQRTGLVWGMQVGTGEVLTNGDESGHRDLPRASSVERVIWGTFNGFCSFLFLLSFSGWSLV